VSRWPFVIEQRQSATSSACGAAALSLVVSPLLLHLRLPGTLFNGANELLVTRALGSPAHQDPGQVQIARQQIKIMKVPQQS
jgi:hypothetical protein